MNKKTGYAMSWVAVAVVLAAIAGCSTEVDPTADEGTGQESLALINTGGLGVDGDSCSITGGPLGGSTGTRSGNYCCTKPNGEGHCQDCTTPSDWCKSTVKVKRPIGWISPAPITTAVLSR